MLTRHYGRNEKGLTLIEILAVLVIMGVLVSVATKKFDLLTDTTSISSLRIGIRELNTRESLVWTKMKISDAGYSNDEDVYNAVDKNLGPGYSWNPGPGRTTGGTLHFRSQSVPLLRNVSTRNSAGSWN
jgi:prepilin-type N-terminal cleavage/methylation domain-containing protein